MQRRGLLQLPRFATEGPPAEYPRAGSPARRVPFVDLRGPGRARQVVPEDLPLGPCRGLARSGRQRGSWSFAAIDKTDRIVDTGL